MTNSEWPLVFTEPLGKTIVGNTLDVNKKSLERLLQFYDPLLYIRWNPKKRKGWGKWEIRRRTDASILVFQGELPGGIKLYTSEKKELDIVNHVLDLDYLSYDCIGKLKRMDTWTNKNYVADLEYEEKKYKDKLKAEAREELTYNIKQHKREWREFAALVQSGVNPARVWKG